MAVPPSENSCGMMKARASLTAIPSRSVAATASSIAGRPSPSSATDPPQSSAVVASIAGYIGEIRAPQPGASSRGGRARRGWGCSRTTGWRGRRWGSATGGCITDCFGSAPHRRMQTLRKLPRAAPSSAKYPTMRPSGRSVSIHTRDLTKQDCGGDRHVERLRSRREPDGHPAARGRLERGAHAGALVSQHQPHHATVAARRPRLDRRRRPRRPPRSRSRAPWPTRDRSPRRWAPRAAGRARPCSRAPPSGW